MQPIGSGGVIWTCIAVLAGAASAAQTTVNSLMGGRAGIAVAALLSTFVTTTILALWVFPTIRVGAALQAIRGASPHEYLGGVFGGAFVIAAMALAPKIGVAQTTAALVFGQIVASLLIDHFGIMGAPRLPLTTMQIAGIAIMGVGLVIALYGRAVS